MKKAVSGAQAIRVLIADDHNLFRAGVRGLLKTFGGIARAQRAAMLV